MSSFPIDDWVLWLENQFAGAQVEVFTENPDLPDFLQFVTTASLANGSRALRVHLWPEGPAVTVTATGDGDDEWWTVMPLGRVQWSDPHWPDVVRVAIRAAETSERSAMI